MTETGEKSPCCGVDRAAGGAAIEARRPELPALELGDNPIRAERVRIPGGVSQVGTDRPQIAEDGEGPARKVRLKPFAIECHAVTNRRFAAFVCATGYRSDAEQFGWSFVFVDFVPKAIGPTQGVAAAPWWRRVDGAFWAAPEGPGSNIADRLDHPAVHISWNDAMAFAAWAGGRLPSEAEWECAARGGLVDKPFPWGDLDPDDEAHFPCNIWQGRFPHVNTGVDGFLGTAPVDSFAANAFGLYQMSGNVWEWCHDRFRIRSLKKRARESNRVAAADDRRVMKGGSYLCHRSYCYRYRIPARHSNTPDTSTGHLGFRLAYDVS